jgi:hypothetical protein
MGGIYCLCLLLAPPDQPDTLELIKIFQLVSGKVLIR